MNFDGSLIRHSERIPHICLNLSLRLQGILGTTAQAMRDWISIRLNTGANSFPLSSSLVFAASADPADRDFRQLLLQKAGSAASHQESNYRSHQGSALRPSTGELVVVGATRGGVVIVTLPNTFTTTA